MRYFDLCDYRIQQFRRQGIYPGLIACAPDCTSIILLDLLEYIRIQYIMIDPVRFPDRPPDDDSGAYTDKGLQYDLSVVSLK